MWLFNIEADTREQAIARGRSMFRSYPADSVIAKLYSIREADVRPLSKWESELIGYDRAK